jgi:hypothetical protein
MQISRYAQFDGKVVVVGEELSTYDIPHARDSFVRVDVNSARTKTEAGIWIRKRRMVKHSTAVLDDNTFFVSFIQLQEVVKNWEDFAKRLKRFHRKVQETRPKGLSVEEEELLRSYGALNY